MKFNTHQLYLERGPSYWIWSCHPWQRSPRSTHRPSHRKFRLCNHPLRLERHVDHPAPRCAHPSLRRWRSGLEFSYPYCSVLATRRSNEPPPTACLRWGAGLLPPVFLFPCHHRSQWSVSAWMSLLCILRSSLWHWLTRVAIPPCRRHSWPAAWWRRASCTLRFASALLLPAVAAPVVRVIPYAKVWFRSRVWQRSQVVVWKPSTFPCQSRKRHGTWTWWRGSQLLLHSSWKFEDQIPVDSSLFLCLFLYLRVIRPSLQILNWNN